MDYLEDRALGKVILMKVIYGATPLTNRREIKEHFIAKGLFPSKIDYQAVS